MGISRVPEPAPDQPMAPFLRRVCQSGQVYECLALADSVYWIYTHFDLKRQRTFACLASRDSAGEVLEPEPCDCCSRGEGSRIRGYLHVWAIRERREEFLEITPTTWHHCRLSWPAVPCLRGWRVTAKRGSGKTARLAMYLAEPLPSTDMMRMPKEKTPQECLENAMRK